MKIVDEKHFEDLVKNALKTNLRVETEINISSWYASSNEIVTKVYLGHELISQTTSHLASLPGQDTREY